MEKIPVEILEMIVEYAPRESILVCRIWHKISLRTKYMITARMLREVIHKGSCISDPGYRKLIVKAISERRKLVDGALKKISESFPKGRYSYNLDLTFDKICVTLYMSPGYYRIFKIKIDLTSYNNTLNVKCKHVITNYNYDIWKSYNGNSTKKDTSSFDIMEINDVWRPTIKAIIDIVAN